MKEVNKLEDSNLYLYLRDIIAIGNRAVQKAKEENKKFGIPEFFWKNGSIYYFTEEGGLTTNRPDILK